MDYASRFLDAALLPLAILFAFAGAFGEYADWRRGVGGRVRILAHVFLIIVFVMLFIAARYTGATKQTLLWSAVVFLLGWVVCAVIAVKHRLKDTARQYDRQ